MDKRNLNLEDLAALPTATVLANRRDIRAHEVLALRSLVGWDGGDLDIWSSCIANSLDVCGIRTTEGELIGIGFLAGNARHAVLCDLCVHPLYRGRGIALSILARRLMFAAALPVPYLYTSLAPENRLRSVYEALGFVNTGGELFRASLL
jgi:GNAT superfamily N-acetyltransferase